MGFSDDAQFTILTQVWQENKLPSDKISLAALSNSYKVVLQRGKHVGAGTCLLQNSVIPASASPFVWELSVKLLSDIFHYQHCPFEIPVLQNDPS